MSEITGNTLNTITKAEHDDTGGANTKKVLGYGWDGTNKVRLKVDSTGRLDTTATVQTGDIEIGAVEIKNATDDTRAIVTAAGAVTVDGSAVTQPVSGTFWQTTQPVSGTFWQATQPVSGTVTVNHANTGLGDGRKTVTTAGTAEALAGSTSCKEVTITAETDNTGIIVVGGSTVVAALATRRGTPLNVGDSVTIQTDNLADIFIDTTVNGDGVTFHYLT